MEGLLKYIYRNKLDLFIVFCILSNLFSTYIHRSFYYIGLFILLVKYLNCKLSVNKNANIFFILLALICFTSILNWVLSLKIILFTIILLLTCPIYTSIKWHLYKKKMIEMFSVGFVIVVIINLYAKIIGFNLRAVYLGWEDLTDKQFSGFCDQPMWLAAAAAISSTYCMYCIFKEHNGKVLRIIYVCLLIISVYVTMISGSRSAFLSCLGSMLLVCFFLVKTLGRFVRTLLIVFLFVAMFSPWLLSREITGAMLAKQEYQESIGATSRDELWAQRMAEFSSSPLFGVGFAASGTGDDISVRRVEYGGGWISVLSQMGVLGAIVVFLIVCATIAPVKEMRNRGFMSYLYALLFFFFVHSIVEGYMFQSGWYLCLLFWMVTGLLIENKQYGRYLI